MAVAHSVYASHEHCKVFFPLSAALFQKQLPIELEILREAQPSEMVMGVSGRIREFEEWLAKRPEKRIVVVGHSHFFKHMLHSERKMNNVDVCEWTFDGSDRTTFEWKFKRRLFRANITSARDMHFGPDQSTAAGEVSSCSALEGSCQKQGSVFGSWSTRHIRLQPTGRGNDAGILIFNNSPPAAGDVPRGSSVASLLGAEVQRLPPDFDPLGSVLKLCHEGYDEDIHLRFGPQNGGAGARDLWYNVCTNVSAGRRFCDEEEDP